MNRKITMKITKLKFQDKTQEIFKPEDKVQLKLQMDKEVRKRKLTKMKMSINYLQLSP